MHSAWPFVQGNGQLVRDAVCKANSVEHVGFPLPRNTGAVLQQVREDHSLSVGAVWIAYGTA